MADWLWLLTGACVAALLGALVLKRRGWDRAAEWSPVRIGLGLAITLLAVAAGAFATGVSDPVAPEPRGIGVIVEGVRVPPERGLDVGLTLAAAVEVAECGEDVHVRLTVTPTAEFWVDNRRNLRDEATVHVVIPWTVRDIRATTASDALLPVTQPLTSAGDAPPWVEEEVPFETPDAPGPGTVVSMTIPRWVETMRPIVLYFDAAWTEQRTRLGSCYVALPALTGFPTVFTALEALGLTDELEKDPGGDPSLFDVTYAGQHGYYTPEYEVTRGVTTLSLGDYQLEKNETSVAPDSSLGGAPAWTCATTIPGRNVSVSSLRPGEEVPDNVFDSAPRSAVAFSAARFLAMLDQPTCASYVAIEESAAGTRRDIVLLGVGALFSLGIELALSGFRSARRASGRGIRVRALVRARRH